MVFSKIPVFQIENKRLRTRQVTKAACRQDQSRLRFSTKSTVTLWKTSRFWGRFSDRTSEPSNIMKVLPFFCSMREKSLFSGHSPDAIFFLFVNGGDEVMETLSWFVAALHQCETRRFSWRQPGTLARPEKKPGFSYPGGKGLYGVWRLSLIRRFCLKTYLYIIYIYIYLWRWELKDQSPRLCHQKLTELTHVVSSGSRTIRWWAKEKSHRNVASVQSKRCKRTSSRQKLD